MPLLTAAYASLALRLQEDAAALSNRDVVSRLQDSLTDHFRGSGTWGSYLDHFGDAASGDVVYTTGGDTFKAPYEISGGEGAANCVIDHDKKKEVVPRTVYNEEQDEADHYAAMQESGLYTPGDTPICERFVSKAEREGMSAEDFAGNGKSFPINKPEDIMAAVRSIGRAGSGNLGPSGIKNRIIAIAKRKGWESYLPKAWQQGGDPKPKESAAEVSRGDLQLRESVAFDGGDIELREAFAPSRQIKLIAPGKGSSAFYPAEVLKRDGPRVFKAGTPMRIDHPTRADEAARPEGSVKDWGAVLESDAVWLDDHKQGPGLYGSIKPFSDYAQMIEEKGPYAGVSIRANGNALMESGKVKMRDGVPVLAELTTAEGVDMVTRAGAGGMFLQESARAAHITEGQVDMTKEEIALLISEAVKTATTPLRERALRGDAVVAGQRALAGVAFTDEQKMFAIEEAIRSGLPEKDGALDETKFCEVVMVEAKRLGKIIAPGGAAIKGLGAATEVKEAKGKKCPDCDGDGTDDDGEDCSSCGGTGMKKMKESAAPDTDKQLASLLSETLGLSESAAGRAAKGRG